LGRARLACQPPSPRPRTARAFWSSTRSRAWAACCTFRAANSAGQARVASASGIVDDVEQHLEDVERLSHGQSNSALVRESVLRQGEMVAVGELLGASQFMGDNFVGGISVGPCIALGRMLGQRLAQRQPVGSATP